MAKVKDEFEYPEDLLILCRDVDSAIPGLVRVSFVPIAKVYMDDEKNIFEPSTGLHKEDEEAYLTLTTSDRVYRAYRERSDKALCQMFAESLASSFLGKGVMQETFSERHHLGCSPTLFRTVEAAHRALHKACVSEVRVIADLVKRVEDWFKTNELDLELPDNEEEENTD